MSDGETIEPADTMGERSGASRLALWVLVDAHRFVVAGVWMAIVFVSLVGVGLLYPDATAALQSGDPVETAFQAFVGATITGVTLVLTLNQVVLSQELGAVGDQRERMAGAMAFRRDVESHLDEPVSPTEPAAFLRALIGEVASRATRLQEVTAESQSGDGELAEAVEEFTAEIVENAESVREDLEGAQFGTFDVVSGALDFNYSWKIYRARRMRAEYAETLSGPQDDALVDLVDALELFGPAREHIKTLYIQWELVELSRAIAVAAVPSLVVSTGTLFYVDAVTITGLILGIPLSVLTISAAVGLSLLPFAILLSYVLRIATVTRRTLAIGPFTLRRTGRDDQS